MIRWVALLLVATGLSGSIYRFVARPDRIQGIAPILGLVGASPNQSALPAAQAIVTKWPLHADAYFAAGLAAARVGQGQRAGALVTHAIQMNPRLFQARLWQAQSYITSNRPEEAIREFAVVLRLRGGSQEPIATVLGRAAADPGIRRAIAKEFRQSPHLLSIARSASQAGLPSAELRQLLTGTNLAQLPGGLGGVQASLMSGPLAEKEYAGAYAIWASLLAKPPANAVFDGSFENEEASPPFAWRLENTSDIQTRRVSGALRVSAFGSLPALAAEQQLLLPPGASTISFQARSSVSSTPAKYEWRLKCQSGKNITNFAIAPSAEWTTQAMRLEIPADCGAQTLQLYGTATGSAEAPILIRQVRANEG